MEVPRAADSVYRNAIFFETPDWDLRQEFSGAFAVASRISASAGQGRVIRRSEKVGGADAGESSNARKEEAPNNGAVT